MKKFLITGITGQDGSYLAELYLKMNWEVHGLVRRTSQLNRTRIDHLFNPGTSAQQQKIKLHYCDLQDLGALIRVIDVVQPEIIVNFAAQSHVAISFEVPIETSSVTGLGALHVFEAARIVNKEIVVYQAGSSEMFGGMLGRDSLDENSVFFPKSPYAAAKVFAHNQAIIYRDSYGMRISNGILFNHESPRRGENFVSRKITLAVARILEGKQSKLKLGNMLARRDWGHAKEYVKAVSAIVSAKEPDDFVVATGKSYSVQDFAEKAFQLANLDIDKHLEIDQQLFRPNEVEDLLGNPAKINTVLGWKHETNFTELVLDMLNSDIKLIREGN